MQYVELRKRGVYLGRAGEEDRKTVWLDVTAWADEYEGGSGVLLFTSPSGSVWPMGTTVETDDSTGTVKMLAPVTIAETAMAGNAHIEAQWLDGTTVAKSQIYNALILASTYTGETVLDTTPGWVKELIQELDAAGTLLEELGEVASEAQAAYDSAAVLEVDVSAAAEDAAGSADEAEAWAVGQRGGTDVESTDQTYENNSKYYAENAEAFGAGTRNGDAVEDGDAAYHANAKYYSEQAAASATAAATSEGHAMSATPEGYAALVASVADVYSSAATYAVGDLVLYNSGLYKCNTAITTAEAWTAAHWTAVTIDDLFGAQSTDFDINNYLTNNGIFEITQANLVSGVWNYTTPSANAERLRTNMLIPVKTGTVVEYSTETDQMIYLGEAETETSGSTGFISPGWVSGEGSWILPKDGFLTFNVKTNPEANISVSDYDSTVVIKTYNRREMDRMSTEITDLKTQTTCALTAAEVSALDTIFDVRAGKYFTVTGAKLRTLIDHDINPNVPVGNVAPSIIEDSIAYLVFSWEYSGTYAFYEIKSVRGAVHVVGGTAMTHPNYITWFDISHDNYQTNNGIFEITQANLVSGVWEYTTPSANAERLRTDMLIPVKTGMVVEYSTETDQMIYLGEAETATSGSTGFISPGWVSGEGSWILPKDGFLTFNVKTNPEANISVSDYDSTVVIKTYNRREMDRMSTEITDLKTQTTCALTAAEVSALDTIFDVSAGKYFTVTGARLKTLIDHDINPNVPDGNVAPSIIEDSIAYLVFSWKYAGTYAFYEIKRVRGTVHVVGGTGETHPNYITWFDISHQKTEDDISELNKNDISVKNAIPVFDGDSFGWEMGKLLLASGDLHPNPKVATSYPVSVKPGDIFVNKSATTDDGGNCYLYVGYYSGETFIRRAGHIEPNAEYVVPSGVDNMRFSFGVSFAETYTYYMDDVKLKNLFHIQFITEYKQAASFVDSEKPLYIALGASTTWGAVHHADSDITQSQYQYPIIAGNLIGADVVNLAVGGTGVLARTGHTGSYATGARVNSIAFNNGDNNYMDLVYANNDPNSELYKLFSKASLITLSLAVGNDFTPVESGGIRLPVGDYDDYYPYDEEGYHISGREGPAQMKALGATYFGCLNWIIKWISEHYPKAQLTIIEIHMSDNSKRTIEVVDNSGTGSPKKLEFADPFPSTSAYYKLNEGLKTLANLIKFPFINLFEDGIPYNYYNCNAKDGEGKYILFSTVGSSGNYTFNGHPSDDGYLMIARYIAGRIAGVFAR